MKYKVSFGWDLGCDQMFTDYTRTFDNRGDAEIFQQLILDNNTKEYDMSRLEKVEEDLGPEYDSAGFTEEDRVVDGQYMNREK
jgi:hypothetical protein